MVLAAGGAAAETAGEAAALHVEAGNVAELTAALRRALTDKKLRRGAHRSIQALEKDIREWITHWNDNPQPFA